MSLVSFKAYIQTFEWKGQVCEFLAILKGDRDANKMPMGDAKLRNVKCKVILWPNLHDF